MLTRPKTGTTGATFIKAPYDSAFGKVFLNNMDANSFSTDLERNTIERQIAFMISNSKTAMFYVHGKMSETQAFRNCQVSKIDTFLTSLFIY